MGNSQRVNRYSYVQGNPVSLIEPLGLLLFHWKALGYGQLNALGMILYKGKFLNL